jgi:hypothetical protein
MLLELNTLVWTSKSEAEAAMKAAAAKARAAELAAATAATAAAATAAAIAGSAAALLSSQPQQQQQGAAAAPTDRAPLGVMSLQWLRGSLGRLLGGQRPWQPTAGYQPLPAADPEAGLWAGGGALAGNPASAAAAAAGGGGAVASAGAAAGAGKPSGGSVAGSTPRTGDAAFLDPSGEAYGQFMEAYEERCEGVLTQVYQSMFKVKEHAQLAESEVRARG